MLLTWVIGFIPFCFFCLFSVADDMACREIGWCRYLLQLYGKYGGPWEMIVFFFNGSLGKRQSMHVWRCLRSNVKQVSQRFICTNGLEVTYASYLNIFEFNLNNLIWRLIVSMSHSWKMATASFRMRVSKFQDGRFSGGVNWTKSSSSSALVLEERIY